MEYSFKQLKMRVNPLFFALFPAAAVLGFVPELFVLLVSAFLHELAHIVSGIVCGLKTERMEITILGFTAVLCGIEQLNTAKKYLIYLSGPIISLFIVLIAFFTNNELLLLINSIFLIFNLMPAKTLDCGRVLNIIIAGRIGFLRAAKVMRRINYVVCGFIIAAGIVQVIVFPPNVTLFLLGIILLVQEKKQNMEECLRFISFILSQNTKYTDGRKLHVRCSAHPAAAPAKTLLDSLDYSTISIFYIYDITGIITILPENIFVHKVREHGINGNIESLFNLTA